MCGIAVLTIVVEPGESLKSVLSSNEMPTVPTGQYVQRWCHERNARKHTHVGSERYTIPTGRSIVTQQLDAIEGNGMLRFITSQCEVTFQLQPRAEVKKLVPDKLLRKLDWFKQTKDGHANDAARHACFLLFSLRPEWWMRLLDSV